MSSARKAVVISSDEPLRQVFDLKLTREALQNAAPNVALQLPSSEGHGRTWRTMCYLGGKDANRHISIFFSVADKTGPQFRCFIEFSFCGRTRRMKQAATMSNANR